LYDTLATFMAPHNDEYTEAVKQAQLAYDNAIADIESREHVHSCSAAEKDRALDVLNAAIDAAWLKLEISKNENYDRVLGLVKIIEAKRGAEMRVKNWNW
jgi:hypothetical protein